MSEATPAVPPNSIADCVLNTFDALPQRFKPRKLDNGRREWVPLAGIVLTKGHSDITAPSMTCAALATGMKCLPQSKIVLANGNVLHDWHAEVLAIRAFNRWLIDECADLARNGLSSENAWLRWRIQGQENGESLQQVNGKIDRNRQPFELKDDVQIHIYCSEAPCGDASMELTMADQDDPSPWTSQPSVSDDGTVTEMLGRGNFDHLGIVRRKPARPDAPLALSKSCSDKLALKQVTGILSGLNTLLVHPQNAYISQLIMPASQCVPLAVDRAFSENGRMSPLAGQSWLGSEFSFKPFTVTTTTREFAFSKRTLGKESPIPSNLSAMRTLHRQEVLINGVLQGRKQLDPKGASCVSRRSMWQSLLDLALFAGLPALAKTLSQNSYADVKAAESLASRAKVKHDATTTALRNWIKNEGDEHWSLDR